MTNFALVVAAIIIAMFGAASFAAGEELIGSGDLEKGHACRKMGRFLIMLAITLSYFAGRA